MSKIYLIGGSPCSGKSTVAEIIAKKYGFHYFKVDDYLNKYMEKGKEKGKPFATKALRMSPDEIWLRNPDEQTEEEIEIYREIFEFVLEDLKNITNSDGIITEGAAFLPELVHSIGIDTNSYICIVPTKEFQYQHYKQRPWVPYILKDCSDKEQAFENWMERDAMFAIFAKHSAEKLGYKTILTDGISDINAVVKQVCNAFMLE
jgi:2-phosphoglycerate kinase